jgi:hypothetical protein
MTQVSMLLKRFRVVVSDPFVVNKEGCWVHDFSFPEGQQLTGRNEMTMEEARHQLLARE